MENNAIYTKESWELDGSFSADVGQEISEEIYNDMLNCMPPYSLPRAKAEYALSTLKIPVHAGFLMGEPHSCDKGGQLYLAFGMNDYGKGKHYYYLGLAHKQPELNGVLYYFDCLSTPPGGKFYALQAFDGDQDAINTAANYEAVLYKNEYRNGERISSVVLYDPWRSFEE